MTTQELDLKEFTNDPVKFAEACGYMIYPSFNLEQLKACLAIDPSLAAATGRYGSAAFYAADRDGDEEFINTLLATQKVPLDHISEAIGRASSNGRLSVLRVFVCFAGEKAINCNNRKDKILAECDGGDGAQNNGPCYRYLKMVVDGRDPKLISHSEINLFDDPNTIDVGSSGKSPLNSNDVTVFSGAKPPKGCCIVS